MDSKALTETIVRSADEIYEYFEMMQWVTDPPLGMSESRISSYTVKEGYAILTLSTRLSDTSGLYLKAGDTVLDEEQAGFTRYDEVSKTIVIKPGEDFLQMLDRDSPELSLLSDMKFLIRAVREFYSRYGDYVRIPLLPEQQLKPLYPEEGEPTTQQIEAAESILRATMSYIWGAPGTGKTQFVLSSCIRACLDNGERIAVFAPTNNSVEQVLRGILSSFPNGEIPEGVVRLGIPTQDFLTEHPEMCEDRQAQRRLEECMAALECMEELLYERRCDAVSDDLRLLKGLCKEDETKTDLLFRYSESESPLERLGELCSMRSDTLEHFESNRPFIEIVDELERLLYKRERPASAITEYDEWRESDIIEKISALTKEEEELRHRSTGNRIQEARIIAGTPQQFISRFRPKGSPEDSRMELDVDRIFLDEAGYCNLIQALSLFSNGVPLAMLGDHMQLPPVSQLDDEFLKEKALRSNRLSNAFLWNLPALFCEQLLTCNLSTVRSMYIDGMPPSFEITERHDLSSSRRFGYNLAKVLDRYVYKNGMEGDKDSKLEIMNIDVVCESREARENLPEAIAVAQYLKKERPDPHSVCILSPYTTQCRTIKERIPRRYRDCVMTVHGSQGREWDTVIFSVADNGIQSRDVPLRFTSSSTPIGLKVVNTAVSRAKKRLIIVCDRSFWKEKDDELIGGLLEASERVIQRTGCDHSE